MEKTPLRLSLIENAFDSLNESLGYVEKAHTDATRWKFAVLNLVHAVELVLKQRLFDEHELLLWENVDRPGKTVSLETALARLQSIRVGIEPKDLLAIQTAIRWRNNITHYEVDLVAEEVRENYLLIFEFLDGFHDQHFEGSLSEKIRDDYVQTAMDLVESFQKEFIEFRGRSMHRKWPSRLLAAQAIVSVSLEETEFARIAWGAEARWSEEWMAGYSPKEFCKDCACAIGDLHGPYCNQEECPQCGGQFLGCECEFDASELWALDDPAREAATRIRLAVEANLIEPALRAFIDFSDYLSTVSEASEADIPEPESTGSAGWDAALAAVVDYWLSRAGLPKPDWLDGESRFAAEPESPHLGKYDLAPDHLSVPPEFFRRNVLIEISTLQST
ncbi:MAG: hypothetical protein H7279_08905 [Microbacteriaceae bacterium]|nr:hypothetical protein [Microbacteriaceae bacterium]